MVKFRKNIAERMMNFSEYRMNDTVNLLKLDESFRAQNTVRVCNLLVILVSRFLSKYFFQVFLRS